jgi:hypothetical protein
LIWSPEAVGDTIPPVVDSISVMDESLITVWFSEDVDPATSLLPGNYKLDKGASISSASQHGLDFSSVDLSVQDLFAGTYSLRISGVTDIENNEMTPDTIHFDFVTVSVQQGVLISDALYPNPSDGLVFFSSHFEGNVSHLRIYNEAGTLIFTSRNVGPFVDLASFQDGLYYFFWRNDILGNRWYQKILLNKN